MASNEDVCCAIDILIRFIRFHDEEFAEYVNLLFSPIRCGDIDDGLMVLKGRLWQATHSRATNSGATDNQATDNQATDNQATDNQATDNQATDSQVSNNKETDDEVVENEVTDNEATDNEETDDQVLIYESFLNDFRESAEKFIDTYKRSPHHFWDRLAFLSNGNTVRQLLKALDGHAKMGDLTQRLLEIKLFEEVQLLEDALQESRNTLAVGESIRSTALKRVLGRKASRVERYRVDRGRKLSVFKFIDLFRITKPHWTRWRNISMPEVQAIRDKMQLVEGEWAKELADLLSEIYNYLPSRTEDSKVGNSTLPSSAWSFPIPVNRINSQGETLESMDDRTVDKEQISNSAEAITSHKRPACDFNLPAAKRQFLGQITLPRPGSQAESEPQNNRGVQPRGFPINDSQHVRGILQPGAAERGPANDSPDLPSSNTPVSPTGFPHHGSQMSPPQVGQESIDDATDVAGGYLEQPAFCNTRGSNKPYTLRDRTASNLMVGEPGAGSRSLSEMSISGDFSADSMATLNLQFNTGDILDPSSNIQFNPNDILDPSSNIQFNPNDILDPSSEIQFNPGDILDPSSDVQFNPGDILDPSSNIQFNPNDILDPSSNIQFNPNDILDPSSDVQFNPGDISDPPSTIQFDPGDSTSHMPTPSDQAPLEPYQQEPSYLIISA